ncbi:MAG TPA: DUF2309 domain-containing protein [Bacteroidia bacterium]|nr:DUF2309 domain-containing protein [Bacteroidia bacterium]
MELHTSSNISIFDEEKTIHHLKHFLPSQAPLKDFVHHNLLHFYQHLPFHTALYKASKIFGFKTYLSLKEYRELFQSGQIDENVLEKTIIQHKGEKDLHYWKDALLNKSYEIYFTGRIGKVMHLWKDYYKVNITKYIQPNLFRIISAYLDQGISLVEFPYKDAGLLENIREVESKSLSSYFFNKKGRACQWLLQNKHLDLKYLLTVLVGNEEWFEDYLFDISYEHPGWSGIVNVLEDHPEYLLHPRKISLKEFLILELLFQIDYLDHKLKDWQPLSKKAKFPEKHYFEIEEYDEAFEVLKLWQESYEWTYYYKVLSGIQQYYSPTAIKEFKPKFQTINCIDDREESIRRYIEALEPEAQTFGTAGFFNMDFYFQPEFSNYYSKVAPANANPKHIVLEKNAQKNLDTDFSLNQQSHSLFRGWLISQVTGYWAAIKLFHHIFKPHDNPASISARKHIDESAQLIYERPSNHQQKINNLYLGFTKLEAAEKIEMLLKSIGLIKTFSPIVYIIGHGAGSTNNPYYAAYDCGACSGKPGSANARVACKFLNDKTVREILSQKGIVIPDETVFIPGLHDTTSDEFYFYDLNLLDESQIKLHQENVKVFNKALDLNAKERARRFVTRSNKKTPEEIHEMIKLREFSLFEPRPEYNHATNAVCIVGRRSISKKLFLDRRSFLNSYNYLKDKNGDYLLSVLKPVAVVCGGINLEYYFSRVDNQKLGAGSKLPHNVYGLIGVANGAEGDLRYGLPQQMVEIHDPIRLLLIVEHYPDIILKTLEKSAETKEWFDNQWIHLVALHPDESKFYYYNSSNFEPLDIIQIENIEKKDISELQKIFEIHSSNLPVYLLN